MSRRRLIVATLLAGCMVVGVLRLADAEAQAISKAVQYLVRVYALDPPLDIIGGVETEPLRTGRIETIDAGYLALTGRGLDMQGFGPAATCSPSGSYSSDNFTVAGVGIYCDETGRPRPLGGAESMPGETSPAGLGNQGPPEEKIFGFTPATTQHCVDTFRINAVVSTAGTCSGTCEADDVAFLTLSQYFLDGGFQEFCRVPIDCAGVEFSGQVDAGFYSANCSGSIQPGTPAFLRYSSDGGCAANPYAKYNLIFSLRTCQL